MKSRTKILSVALLVVMALMFLVSASIVGAQPTPVPVTPFVFQEVLNGGWTLFNQIGLMEIILVLAAIGIASTIFRRFRRAAG